MNVSEFLQLYRLARQRLQSESNYRKFQAFQARQLITHLAVNGMDIRGQSLLDLGSGLGGYSQAFAMHGARVISIDLVQHRLLNNPGVRQMAGSALSVPLKDEAVDAVFCASLIEHVARPEAILTETERVLKKGGVCYFSFPPYYNPTGGHEYAPFHYLGERLAMRLVRRRAVVPQWVYQYYGLAEKPTSFAELSAGWGLYHMTIHKFKRLAARTNLKMVNISTRYLPVSFIRWPLLCEVLTWHAQFILIKP